MFSIGQAAKAAEMPIKTVRYYDEIGLIKSSGQSAKGYRLYGERDIRKLVFVRHARAFGFSIDTCRELLDLYKNTHRTSKEVKRIASQRLHDIRRKMNELQRLHDELVYLTEACHGNDRPDCPIIDRFAEEH